MPLVLVTVDVFWKGQVRGPMMTRSLKECEECLGSFYVSGSLTVEALLKIFLLDKAPVVRVDLQSRGVVCEVDMSARLEDLGADEGGCMVLVHLGEGGDDEARWREEAWHSLEAVRSWSSSLSEHKERMKGDDAAMLVVQARRLQRALAEMDLLSQARK